MILAVLGRQASVEADDEVLDRMIGRPPEATARTPDSEERRLRLPGAALAACRSRDLAHVLGPLGLAQDDGLYCLLEGALYYTRDLRDRLSATGAPGCSSQAELVLHAYRAWGSAVADVLEGDFALVIWDSRVRRAFAARSYPGPIPLHYALVSDGLAVSTSVNALLAHPEVSEKANLTCVVEAAAGLLFEPHPETAHRDVLRVHGGWAFEWSAGSHPTLRRHWRPMAAEPEAGPAHRSPAPASRAGAAEELRAVLAAAVRERAAASGDTAIWLSGGYDSTAVFGAAMQAGAAESYFPVSISYPPGDVGREDEFIEQTAGAWDRPVRWLDIDQIAPRDCLMDHAARRSDPFAHAFDTWNRALARASRCGGARVALGGDGGDQLFTAPPLHLVDHLWSGRWAKFYSQWRAGGGERLAPALGWALRTGFPDGLRGLAGLLRGGRPPVDPLASVIPDWFASGVIRDLGIDARARVERPRGLGSNLAGFEFERTMSSPFFSTTTAAVAEDALASGVVQRSPLWDRRVVRLAATRPADERFGSGETKHLLRDASRGLVPDSVLAPRAQRTGTPDRFFHRLMRERYEPMLDLLIDDSALIRSGAVLREPLVHAVKRYLQERQFLLGARLAFTFEADLWLRTRA